MPLFLMIFLYKSILGKFYKANRSNTQKLHSFHKSKAIVLI